MKKAQLLLAALSVAGMLQACSGDNSAKNGVDSTRSNTYGAPSNRDTSATTASTGEATLVDNSASGGTRIQKDTVTKKHNTGTGNVVQTVKTDTVNHQSTTTK